MLNFDTGRLKPQNDIIINQDFGGFSFYPKIYQIRPQTFWN